MMTQSQLQIEDNHIKLNTNTLILLCNTCISLKQIEHV